VLSQKQYGGEVTADLHWIMLVDPHPVVRAGLRVWLAESGGWPVVAEAESEEQLRDAGARHPSLVITEMWLPGLDGVALIEKLNRATRGAPILVFTGREDRLATERVLEAGVRGVVSKRSGHEMLRHGIDQVLRGEIYLAPDVAQRLALHRIDGGAGPFDALSAREYEIVCLMAQGHSVADIATRLLLSYKTVANYGSRIKQKLRLGNSVDVVRLAIRHGIVNI
jgi:two-component system, NarL family, invasion response regulator UvrY